MSMFQRCGASFVVMVLSASGLASAQTPPAGAPTGAAQTAAPDSPRGQRAGQAGTPINPQVALGQVQEMMDGAALVRAQVAVELSDAQWQAFVPKMRDLQQLRRQHQRNRNQLIQALNVATKPGSTADEATLAARVKALDDLEVQMDAAERTALAAVDAVLTVYQRARFRVFEENIERDKLKLLAKVLAAPGRGPVPSPAPNNHQSH
jgi:hypothetical protein